VIIKKPPEGAEKPKPSRVDRAQQGKWKEIQLGSMGCLAEIP
jgi:hypothetical protein